MSQLQPVTMTDMLSDALCGNKARVHAALMQRYETLSLRMLFNAGDNVSVLTDVLSDHFKIPTQTADHMLRLAVETADNFSDAADMRRQMTAFWSELSDGDFIAINGSRSALVSHLQRRYHLRRDAAWRQLHSFFARVQAQ